MNRKKNIVLILVMVLLIAAPLTVAAVQMQTFEGHMEGLNCIIHGQLCPVDNLDPHIALESDFVLYLANDNHFLLPNIPRVVKAKYVGKAIRVTGEVNAKYKTIKVDKLEVKRGGSYKVVWSKWSQMEEWERWKKEFYEGSAK